MSTHLLVLALTIVKTPPPASTVRNDWPVPPLHVQSRMFVPSALPAPATSTHLPLFGLTSRTRPPPTSCAWNDCAPLPLQVHSWMLVPSAVPAPLMSRHLPLTLVRSLNVPLKGPPGGGGGGGGVVPPLPLIFVPSRHVDPPLPPFGN